MPKQVFYPAQQIRFQWMCCIWCLSSLLYPLLFIVLWLYDYVEQLVSTQLLCCSVVIMSNDSL